MPRVAGDELSAALRAEVAKGLVIGNALAILKRQLKVGLKEEKLFWTASGIPGGPPGYVNNVTFVPGAKGMGVKMNNSVVSFTDKIAQFERTDPYTLDVWVKLRTGKPYEEAVVLSNSGRRGANGYGLVLENNKLLFEITHADPYNMLSIGSTKRLPTGQWLHLTATYDGNSRAGGMKLYLNGLPLETTVLNDRLTRSTRPRGGDSQLGSYYGLQSGKPSGGLELMDGSIDELRVYKRALAPIEVAQLHSPAMAAKASPQAIRAQLIDIAAHENPKVKAAWEALTAARLDEQRIESQVYQMMVLADWATPRPNYILDRGLYNQHGKVVPTQGLERVYKWDAGLPRDRLGLVKWLFDPKHPLTSRVYVNRLWQGHFGTGLVDTVEDFGTQGSNPSHPELLDWLAIEFIRSGWDIKHMHKLMVMSATYRQSSNVTPGLFQRDPANRLLARGPPLPDAGRDDPRQRPLRQRPAGRQARRRQRLPVPAGRGVGQRRGGRHHLSDRRARRSDAPALDVHLLEAQRPAALADDFRHGRPQRRGGGAQDLQHPASGPRAAQRPSVHRGLPQARRALDQGLGQSGPADRPDLPPGHPAQALGGRDGGAARLPGPAARPLRQGAARCGGADEDRRGEGPTRPSIRCRWRP